MAELLIGCGNHRDKLLHTPGKEGWTDLTTLDFDPNSGADIEWDLERLPLPFEKESFQEIHAYHVLEHTGRLGDFRFFFAQFAEFWRILKPDGLLCGIVPAPGSPWVFGDPGHTRFLPPEIFTFLDQAEYTKQIGKTAMADYRHVWREDFELMWRNMIADNNGNQDQFAFVLRAQKPSRIAL